MLPSFSSLVVVLMLVVAQHCHAQPQPVRVFILAGQSNMEGHAKIDTFDYIGDDPATVHLLKQMRGEDGNPTVCDGAWISYLTGIGDNNQVVTGRLTAGYGSLGGSARGQSPIADQLRSAG